MSRYTDALSAFIAADGEYERAQRDTDASRYDVDEMAERLAQAGDVLEREQRQMIREEISAGVLARYTADG